MNFLKNMDSDSMTPFILTTGILLILLSFIVPFPIILFIQDTLFFSYDQIAFIRPRASFLSFAIGMIWIAIVLFSFLFTKIQSEKKGSSYKFTILHLIAFILGLSILGFSIFHYHYLDEKGIYSNSFWSFTEKELLWNDVEKVSRHIDEENYAVLFYTFSNQDTTITIPYDSQDTDLSSAIYTMIDRYEWDILEYMKKK